jgi:hypothetical protein
MPIFTNVTRPVTLTWIAATVVGALGVIGGAISSSPTFVAIAQAQATDPQLIATAVPVEICLDLPDWQRPSSQAQQKQLQTMPQYGAALQDEPLLSVAKDWWGHEIFSFTTYGLSARTDPLYLSGVWTALDATWACYDRNQPEQINGGEMAEVWLLNHRLLEVQWQQDHYVITVEPAESGLQLVQFPRQEQSLSLPLTLMTVAGETLAVMSGDW